MAAGNASIDTMLADAIAKLDSVSKRMDALETGEGHKRPAADSAKKADDDDKKKDDAFTPKKKILDDDDDDKKDDASAKSDDDDDKKDSAKADDDDKKDDDGELEIKHEPKKDSKKADAKKADAKKADAKKADSKKADAKKADAKKADDDDDDRRDDDDDDDRKDSAKAADDDDDDKKDDAAKADSVETMRRQLSDQAATIRRLESLMKPKSDDEHAAFADAQARADAVFNGFGQRAPRPLEGEELLDYRKRLAIKLKSYSPMWKAVKKFSALPEEAFNIAETQIYADATSAASNPTDLEAGELRQVTRTDPTTGVRTISFYGKDCFVKQMGRPGRRVAAFRTLASQ